MSRTSVGWAITAIGIVVLIVSALADQIGLGNTDSFGWKQILGVVVGAVIMVLGFIVAKRGENPANGIDTEA